MKTLRFMPSFWRSANLFPLDNHLYIVPFDYEMYSMENGI
jgi:hypothetical protein